MKIATKKLWLFLILCSFLSLGALDLRAQDFLPELVRRVKPSAVAIETFDARGTVISRGSGFFIAADRIITNRHVIEKSARVEVQLHTGKKYPAKGVLAIDGEGDLALLQVDVPPSVAIPLPVNQRVPLEGESIVVIGNPFGLEGSVSNGIVSAVREIAGYGKIIQITAPISPGSSGSPVVNMYGQVIGIATLQAAEGQSLNFAVPGERIARLRAGELQTFATLASEAVKSKRAAAQTLYSQGLAQLSRDDYGRAATSFERAVEIDPNYVEAWYQLGYAFGMTGRHQDALRASRQAAKLRPDWAETYLNIGASSFALNQFKEAVEAYRQATRLDATNADAFYALGLSLGRIGRADEEILAYQRALAIKSDFVVAWEQIGIAYFKQKRFTDALGAFEQYKTYKADARADNYLGECYLELGRTADAINALNSAVAFNPDFDKARYNLGRAYLKSGDRDSASVQYEMLRNGRSEWADKLLILLNQ